MEGDPLDGFLQERLQARKDSGGYRQLTRNEGLVDFSSNDYLGFARSEALSRINTSSLNVGSTGSRLISGNSALMEETEALLASFHRAPAALLFNSGYMANVGLFSALGVKGHTYLYDEYIHASIHDGMRLGHSSRVKFRHNDVGDLENSLKRIEGKKVVVVESLYSMDGDQAPLKAMAQCCSHYGAALIVDEAHATGIYGKAGEGLVCQEGLEGQVWARIHTFGKALGLHGAVVVGSVALRDFLINHARSFIYATAIPPQAVAHIRQAYAMLPGADRGRLFALVRYFRQGIEGLKGIVFLESASPIQGVVVPGNERALALSSYLREKGIYAKAILSPTVPEGGERIRICLHGFNTEGEIDRLLEGIKQFFL